MSGFNVWDRAEVWQLRTRALKLQRRPMLMGIVNVTPDSFSDGGRFLDTNAAIVHAQQLVAEGADLLDIGGESTRPKAEPVGMQQELDRVLPVIEAVCKSVSVPVSIDTSKAAVARAAVEAGAEIINDITALGGDAEMLDVLQRSGAGVCVMHMQGTPKTMQLNPQYEDVAAEVFEFLRAARDRLMVAGILQERICVDPGIGFGKTPQHNLLLLAECHRLHELGCPVLVGHSRKSFLCFTNGKDTDRDAATIGVACAMTTKGVQILRVHNVAAVRQALAAFDAVIENCPS